MFGLGFSEILVLGVLALILLGPEQLPDLARSVGRFVNDLKRTTDGLKEEFKNTDLHPSRLLEEIKKENPGQQTPENLHGHNSDAHSGHNNQIHSGHDDNAHSGHNDNAHQPLDNTKPVGSGGNSDSGKA